MARGRPHVIVLQWEDDPFSVDLRDQFRAAVYRRAGNDRSHADLVTTNPIPFSIGGYFSPNPYEQKAAEFIVSELLRNPDRRTLLVLPTVTAAARRVLRTVCDAIPSVGDRLANRVNISVRAGGALYS